MKIVCFTGEKYYKNSNIYYSLSDSFVFIENTFKNHDVGFVVGAKESKHINTNQVDNIISEIPFFDSNIDVLKYILNPIKAFKLVRLLDKIIDNNSEALFWIRNPALISIIFSLRLMKKNRKFISHFCADISGISDNKYIGIKKVISKLVENFILKKMDEISKNKNCLLFTTGMSLTKKYENSTHLIDIVIPKDTCNEISSPLSISGYYLFVGRVQEDKGILELIRFFIANVGLARKLLIVGSGKDLYKAKELVTKNNMSDKIIFTGHVNKKTLTQYYKNCYSVIVPSKNSYEGFPRVIIESWRFLKPVILSDLPGVHGIAINMYNCLLLQDNFQLSLKDAISSIEDFSVYQLITNNLKKERNITSPLYWEKIAEDKTNAFIQK